MNEFKGQLKGFPPEVVEKILEYQVKQGNPRNIEVFEERICSLKASGGFDWLNTIEGLDFWNRVLFHKNWNVFFEKYPKNVYPKVMLVSTNKEFISAEIRVVFMEKCDRYLAWSNTTTLEDSEKEPYATTWPYAKDLPEEPVITEVTLEEVAKVMNIPLQQLRIKK